MSAFWLSVVPRRHAHRMVMMVMAMGQRSHREHDIRAVEIWLSICCGCESTMGMKHALSMEFDHPFDSYAVWVAGRGVEALLERSHPQPRQSGTRLGVCTFEQTGPGRSARILVHTRFTNPDAPKFEDAIGKLQKRPEPALRTHPAVVLRKFRSL
jgi:hypothetical protein